MAVCAGKSRPGRAGRILERLAIPNRTRQRLIIRRPLRLPALGLPIPPASGALALQPGGALALSLNDPLAERSLSPVGFPVFGSSYCTKGRLAPALHC